MEERRHTAQSKENDFLTVTSEYGLACAKEHGCLRGNEWIWGIIVNQESHENPCPEEHRDEGKSICWTERAVRKIRKSGYRQTKGNNDGTASRMREWAEPLFPVSVSSSQLLSTRQLRTVRSSRLPDFQVSAVPKRNLFRRSAFLTKY
jgi:hypothetical protein